MINAFNYLETHPLPEKGEQGDVRVNVHKGGQTFKQVYTLCIVCGKGRWTTPQKHRYIDLMCKSCSRKKYLEQHPEHNEKLSIKMKDKLKDPLIRKKWSEASVLKMARPNAKEHLSEKQTAYWANHPEAVEKVRQFQVERLAKPEEKEKLRQTLIERWSDTDYKDRVVRNVMKSMNLRPNKPETIIQNMLDNLYPNKWKYTGNGSLIIGGMNPDFWNGGYKLVELFGTYWHSDEIILNWNRSELGRMMVFKAYGYETLVIWEHELKEPEKVKAKIKQFHDMKVKKH